MPSGPASQQQQLRAFAAISAPERAARALHFGGTLAKIGEDLHSLHSAARRDLRTCTRAHLWLLSGRGHDALPEPPERRGGVWRSRGAPPRDGGSSDLVPPRRALEAAGHAAFKVFEAALAAPCNRNRRRGWGGCSFPPRSPPRRLDGTRTPGAWRIGATARHIPMLGPPPPARAATRCVQVPTHVRALT